MIRNMILIMLGAWYVNAGSFYIDYAGGDDANTGTAPSSAWQHIPSDRNASGVSDGYSAAAGDTFLFKGGVKYHGYFTLRGDGTPQNPVVYKGDGWGTEKALIDGSVPMTGWTRCTSAAEAGGNSNWANIWYADTPELPARMQENPTLMVNLYQDDGMLSIAQYPDMPDFMYPDDYPLYKRVQSLTRTTASDPWLATVGGADLVGGYVYAYRGPVEVDFREITAWDAGSNTVTFGSLAGDPYSTDMKISIANVLHDDVFNRAGEYVLDELNPVSSGVYRVYLWPLDGKDPNTSDVSVSVVNKGITFSGDHNVVEGLIIQKLNGKSVPDGYAMAELAEIKPTYGLTIRNNEIRWCRHAFVFPVMVLMNVVDCVVENNYLHHNVRQGGIRITHGPNIVRNNRLEWLGRTAISYKEGPGEIRNNYLYGSHGTHGNGLTTYGSHDIHIEGNLVLHHQNPYTYQDCNNITLVNNVLHTDKGWVAMCWNASNTSNMYFYHNIFLSGSTYALFTQAGGIDNWVVKNNIIDGVPDHMWIGKFSNNIYTHPAYNTAMRWPGDFAETDLDAIFTDPDNLDFTLKEGSPAIDAGTVIGIDVDIDSMVRPAGTAPDIGPYEYGSISGITDCRSRISDVTAVSNPMTATEAQRLLTRGWGCSDRSGRRIYPGARIQPGMYLFESARESFKLVITY